MLTRRQEFRRAWPVLLAAALGAGAGEAVIAAYSLGALVEPLTQAFGWSRAQVTAAPLFTSLGVLVMGGPVGRLADHFGARRVALVSQVLLVVALAAMSQMPGRLWVLYLAYFLLPVLGAGTLPMTWSRAITGWFVRARGLALGLSLVGSGVIGALLPAYTVAAAKFGVQGAYLGLAAIPLLLSLPFTALLFREPENPARAPEAKARRLGWGPAIRTRQFWQMSLAFFLATIAVSAVLVHAQPLLVDRGVQKPQAAALVGLFGLSIAGGRLFAGWLLDLFPAPRVAFALFCLPAIACLLLSVSGQSLAFSGLAIVLVGLAGGSEHDLAAYLTCRYYGVADFGAIYGLVYTIYGIGSGLGPLLAGQAFQAAHTYSAALYSGAGLFATAALLCAALPWPPAAEFEATSVADAPSA